MLTLKCYNYVVVNVKRAYCVVFINTGQFSVKELATYDNPLHSISALNFAKALFKDIITFDFSTSLQNYSYAL